jgi:hypothetical protein
MLPYYILKLKKVARIAQSVEQRIENPWVTSSSLVLGIYEIISFALQNEPLKSL